MSTQQGAPPRTDEVWEAEPRRERRWWRVPAVLVLVLLGALLLRPSSPSPPDPAGLQVLPGQPAAPPDAGPLPDPVPDPPQVAVVHALSTAGLGVRVQPLVLPLEGRRLRSAMSSRGRQLVALGLEDPLTGEAVVQVRDSSSLRPVAELGPVQGPLEHLGVSEDGLAVVWARSAGPHGEARAQRWTFDGTETTVPLPEDFEVRDVRGLRDGRIAILGTDPAEARGTLRVLVHQEEAGMVVDTILDAGEGAPSGMVNGSTVVHPRSAHVWNDRRLRLHLVHADKDALTTVDLRTGAAVLGPEGLDRTGMGVVRRDARLLSDTDMVVATGDLTRPNAAQGISRDATLPLEPLLLGMPREGDGGSLARGEAQEGTVVAAGPEHAVLAAPLNLTGGGAGTQVRLVDRDLATTWSTVVTGQVTAASINHRETHLLLVRSRDGATVVSEHPLDGGAPTEQTYRPDAAVHLGAVVVIEHH